MFNEVENILYKAFKEVLLIIQKDYKNNSIGGLNLVATGGYASFSFSITSIDFNNPPKEERNTKEFLEYMEDLKKNYPQTYEKKINIIESTPEYYMAFHAVEWEDYGVYNNILDELNEYIYNLYEKLYELEWKEEDIEEAFEHAVSNVFIKLKSENAFNLETFIHPPLLGLQFLDEYKREFVLKISKIINSEERHAQFEKCYYTVT